MFDVRQTLSLNELSIQNLSKKSSVFDLSGRAYQLGEYMPEGIYIVNGEKVYLSK